MAKKTVLRDLSDADLFEQLGAANQKLFNLRFQHVTGQLDNSALLGRTRKEIARLKTEVREREIAAADALAEEES